MRKIFTIILICTISLLIVILSFLFINIVFDPSEWNVYKIPNHPQEFIVKKIDRYNPWGLRQKAYPHHGLIPNNLPMEFQQDGLRIFCKVKYVEVSGSDEWLAFTEIDWCHKF